MPAVEHAAVRVRETKLLHQLRSGREMAAAWRSPKSARLTFVMATDYPHFDSTFPKTVRGIRERPDISPKQKKLILEDNALNLIRLSGKPLLEYARSESR